jgi:hypothetical protein
MNGGITFRDAINSNKRKILEYLSANGKKYTNDIYHEYSGEKEMPAIRKALNELRAQGLVSTDDKVRMWQGKLWWVVSPGNEEVGLVTQND